MSRDNSNNLPSYRDFMENPDDLPSIEEFKEENLPSVEDFLEKTVEEETQTIENSDGESFLEVTDVVQAPEWSELVRLVNDVRKDIPKIPEIKYYDDQLEEISANIAQIQDNYAKSEKIDDPLLVMNCDIITELDVLDNEKELTQTISAVNIEGTTIGQDQKTQITTIVSGQEVKLTRSVASSTSIQIDSGESYLVVLEQDGVTNQVKVNGGGSSVIVIRQSQ